MKQEKIDRAVHDLTSVASKVYACVPVQEIWETKYICSELTRKGIQLDSKMIMGCLDSLKKDGLVKEPSKGTWIQVKAQGPGAVHLKTVKRVVETNQGSFNPKDWEEADPDGNPPPAPRDPLLILMEFTEKMTALRKEFDDAADEITRYIELHQAEAEEDKILIDLLEKRFKRK